MTTDVLGAPVRRREDPRFITGKGRYLDDIKLPSMAHVAVLRSPYAHANIKRIDTAAAKAMPGVIAVIVGADIPYNPLPMAWPAGGVSGIQNNINTPRILATDSVKWTGEGVAAVVAETLAEVDHAGERCATLVGEARHDLVRRQVAVVGRVHDAQDLATLFTDDTETVPSANGADVGRWKDKSGNNRHADKANIGANKPHRLDNAISTHTGVDFAWNTPIAGLLAPWFGTNPGATKVPGGSRFEVWAVYTSSNATAYVLNNDELGSFGNYWTIWTTPGGGVFVGGHHMYTKTPSGSSD